MKSISNQNHGFSLIELVVAIAIMILLLGGGIAAFAKFNDKQKLLSASRELGQLLRIAQTKARAREIPDDGVCDPVDNPIMAYRVISDGAGAPGTLVRVYPICGLTQSDYGDPDSNSDPILSLDLPTNITLEEAMKVDFQALYGGAQIDGASTFHLSSGSNQVEFSISEGGAIGDVVESIP
ncbi:MAG: prepilin-type N-terminal cleavage/methylation domain-containing protein [Patescibacteria group bacterium]|nr:prepilin-type N-terminal cleavage/methylation domain-containing protein [Patescibacteria group bacterium]